MFWTLALEAGKLNVVCLSGTIIQKFDTEDAWVVLREAMWATLVWPLQKLASSIFVLDERGNCKWMHVYEPGHFEALPSVAVWGEYGLSLVQTDDPMPLLKYALLRNPKALVYNSLLILAQYLELQAGSEEPSQKVLLQRLAESQAFGDMQYVAEVLEADDRKAKAPPSESEAAMLDCLFSNLDLDERMEYRDLKQKSEQSAHMKKQQRWSKWLKEKHDEKEARWTVVKVLFVLNTLRDEFLNSS